MNKKFMAVFAALLVAGSATGIFAKTGLGIQFTGNPNTYSGSVGGAAVTFKLESLPCVFAANAGLGNNHFSFGITADWWLGNPTITTLINGPLGWYYGLGLAGAFSSWDNGVEIFIGGRGVIGLNWYVIKPLELYLQAAAEIGGAFGVSNYIPAFGFPISLGFRFWF